MPGSFLAPVTPRCSSPGLRSGSSCVCGGAASTRCPMFVRHLPVAGRLTIDFASAALRQNNQGRSAGRARRPPLSVFLRAPRPATWRMVAETAALRRDAFFRGLYHPCGTGSSKGNRRRSAAAQSQAAVTALVHPAGQIGGGDPAKAHHPYLSGQPCNSRAMVALSTRPDGLIPSRQSPCPIALKAAKYTLPRRTARCVNVTRGRC